MQRAWACGLLSSGLLWCGAAAAQRRVWVVDQSGGGQFTEIQPAIDAARAGDRIEVRGAATVTYQGFTLAKGLDLEATQGAAVPGCRIQLIPVGAPARVAGFRFVGRYPPVFTTLVVVENCAGPVLLDHLEVLALDSGMWLVNAAAVFLRDCTVRGGWVTDLLYGGRAAVLVTDANATLQRCAVVGGPGRNANLSGHLMAMPGATGLNVGGGHVLLTETFVSGGPGGNGSSGLPAWWGGTGVAAVGAEVLVFGNSIVRGGPHGLPSSGGPGTAIDGDPQFPTAVRVTSDCLLYGATANLLQVPALPYLVSPGVGQLGNPVALTLRGMAGAAGFLLADFQHAHVMVPGVDGAVLLPPTTAIPLFPVVVGGSGILALSFALPNDPLLRNEFAFLQAVVLTPGALVPSLTNLGDLRLR